MVLVAFREEFELESGLDIDFDLREFDFGSR